MSKCATIPFLPEFSGCLVETPSCNFAVRCGFSFHCEHPQHQEFHVGGDQPAVRKDLPHHYKSLKESRRLKYLAEVNSCHETANFLENNAEYLSGIQPR